MGVGGDEAWSLVIEAQAAERCRSALERIHAGQSQHKPNTLKKNTSFMQIQMTATTGETCQTNLSCNAPLKFHQLNSILFFYILLKTKYRQLAYFFFTFCWPGEAGS